METQRVSFAALCVCMLITASRTNNILTIFRRTTRRRVLSVYSVSCLVICCHLLTNKGLYI